MIFCDLDGVLANFRGYFISKFGYDPTGKTRLELREDVLSDENFWLNFPKMEGADKLWSAIKEKDKEAKILTACPIRDWERSTTQKRKWVDREIDDKADVIFCIREDKVKRMKPGDILIDDMEKNIQEWEKAGGVGILYKSAEETISKLNKHFELRNRKTFPVVKHKLSINSKG